MTNNQNWPDRVYLVNKFDLSVFDHRINPDDAEYISSEKVREIQLATIKATLEKVATNENLHLGDLQSYWLLKTDPQSIIERVNAK